MSYTKTNEFQDLDDLCHGINEIIQSSIQTPKNVFLKQSKPNLDNEAFKSFDEVLRTPEKETVAAKRSLKNKEVAVKKKKMSDYFKLI